MSTDDFEVEVTPKNFILLPRDAYYVLKDRHASLAQANAAAVDRVNETRDTVYVLEVRAVAALESPPVVVTPVPRPLPPESRRRGTKR